MIQMFLFDFSKCKDLEGQVSAFELNDSEKLNVALKRQQYLASRGLLRKVLFYCYKVELPEQFAKDVKGALLPVEGHHFNLSHSGTWVAVAIADKAPLGVDIESHSLNHKFDKLAQRYMNEQEYKNYLTLDSKERVSEFFRLWTLKEAYGKALGLGLQADLKDLVFADELIQNANQIKMAMHFKFKELYVSLASQALGEVCLYEVDGAWNERVLEASKLERYLASPNTSKG